MSIAYDEGKDQYEIWSCDSSLEGAELLASVKMIAACPTLEAANAAYRLLFGGEEAPHRSDIPLTFMEKQACTPH